MALRRSCRKTNAEWGFNQELRQDDTFKKWTIEEKLTIAKLVRRHGERWREHLAATVPGRSAAACAGQWVKLREAAHCPVMERLSDGGYREVPEKEMAQRVLMHLAELSSPAAEQPHSRAKGTQGHCSREGANTSDREMGRGRGETASRPPTRSRRHPLPDPGVYDECSEEEEDEELDEEMEDEGEQQPQEEEEEEEEENRRFQRWPQPSALVPQRPPSPGLLSRVVRKTRSLRPRPSSLTRSLAVAGTGSKPLPGPCRSCGATDSPQWRTGPEGLRTLCNACGVRYSRGLPRAGHVNGRSQWRHTTLEGDMHHWQPLRGSDDGLQGVYKEQEQEEGGVQLCAAASAEGYGTGEEGQGGSYRERRGRGQLEEEEDSSGLDDTTPRFSWGRRTRRRIATLRDLGHSREGGAVAGGGRYSRNFSGRAGGRRGEGAVEGCTPSSSSRPPPHVYPGGLSNDDHHRAGSSSAAERMLEDGSSGAVQDSDPPSALKLPNPADFGVTPMSVDGATEADRLNCWKWIINVSHQVLETEDWHRFMSLIQDPRDLPWPEGMWLFLAKTLALTQPKPGRRAVEECDLEMLRGSLMRVVEQVRTMHACPDGEEEEVHIAAQQEAEVEEEEGPAAVHEEEPVMMIDRRLHAMQPS